MAGAEPSPLPVSATQIASNAWRPMSVNADATDLIGRYARIYLRLDRDAKSGDETRVLWRDRSGKSGTLSAPAWRSLVFEGVIASPVFDGAIELAAVCSLREQYAIAITPHLEIDAVDRGSAARTLRAVSADPITLSLPCTNRTSDRWTQTDVTGTTVTTDSLAVDPGSRGVRVERRFSRQRIAFSPEATTDHGIQLGGGIASIVPGGAAAVLLSAGPEKREVVVNSLWSVPGGTVFLTLGRQSQHLTLGNDAGGRSWVTQRGGGGGYAFTFPGAWSAQLGGEAYVYATDSRDLASTEYSRDDGHTEEFFLRNDRLAGSILTGFQSRASFSPLRGSTANVALGREEVTFDFAAGHQVTKTITRGLSWSQQLPGRLNLTAGEHLYSSHVARSLSLGYSSSSGRHQVGIDVSSRRGRDGAPSDTQVRIGYAIAFGSPAGPATTSARPVTDSSAHGPLSQVSARPSFMPYLPMATLDHTVVPKRLVAINKDAIPESASIDDVTGTVAIPTVFEG